MTQRRFFALLLLVLVLCLLMVGCASNKPTPKPITELPGWKDYEISDQQTDFFKSISVTIEKVDPEAQTATVSVVLPDLEKYLKDGDYSAKTISLIFPVQQVDGEWQIDSLEPLTEYIRTEASSILHEAVAAEGGIVIDFDPQEVPEE